MTGVLGGCGESVGNVPEQTQPVETSSQESDIYSGKSIKTIGISMPASQLERWHKDAERLQGLFEDAGYDVMLSYGDNLIDTQIDEINKMIDDGAELLIIAPVDSDSLLPCIEKANEKGIPIVAYDRLIYHDPNLLAYVSYDNYKVGTLQGQFIADALDLKNAGESDKYNIEIFAGDPADNNAIYFYNGAMDVLKPYFDSGNITVLSNQTSFYSCSTSSWSSDLAMERMEIMLTSYYSSDNVLNAVLSSNDSIALGVCRAIEASYKKDNNIIITGQDCDTNNIPYIRDEKQSMSIYKDLKNEAYATFCIVESYLKGVSTGEDLSKGHDIDFEITRDTTSYVSDGVAITSYLLTPEVITHENVDDLPE
ncbi:MAG: sugar-binding protein [Acetatifactor sp.]|nr:sugar-binding protein [Acetatifactor sp.]